MRLTRLLALACMALFSVSTPASSYNAPSIIEAATQPNALRIVLTPSRSAYTLRDDILVRVEVQNVSNAAVRLLVMGAADDIALVITDSRGTALAQDPALHPQVHYFNGRPSLLQPGHSIIETGTGGSQYTPLSAWGYRPTQAGVYQIVARKRESGSQSNAVTITVSP